MMFDIEFSPLMIIQMTGDFQDKYTHEIPRNVLRKSDILLLLESTA
jgi:hypothetical protein